MAEGSILISMLILILNVIDIAPAPDDWFPDLSPIDPIDRDLHWDVWISKPYTKPFHPSFNSFLFCFVLSCFKISITLPFFTHCPQRWNHGSSDGLFLLLLLLLLLLHTSNFPGNSRQSSDSYLFLLLLLLFYFQERFCPILSGELSIDSRQSSDSYFSSVESSPGLDIKLAQTWLTNKSQPCAGQYCKQ